MKLGILGTGQVASTIGLKLVQLGHHVMLGARTPNNEKAAAWSSRAGKNGSHGTFAEAARFGEIVWNCTAGAHSLAAIELAQADNLRSKTLLDISNPLDFSKGFPPTLSVCNDDSLGERIQAALPDTRVVKTLNTVANPIMVQPSLLAGSHDMFMCGNSDDAKAEVRLILEEWFGWQSVIDLGDISMARGTEAYLLLWTRLYGAMKTGEFNVRIVRADTP